MQHYGPRTKGKLSFFADSRTMTSQVDFVYLNRGLRDGLVVFLSADGEWSERIEDAAGAMNESGALELMATANQSEVDSATLMRPSSVPVSVMR